MNTYNVVLTNTIKKMGTITANNQQEATEIATGTTKWNHTTYTYPTAITLRTKENLYIEQDISLPRAQTDVTAEMHQWTTEPFEHLTSVYRDGIWVADFPRIRQAQAFIKRIKLLPT